MSEEYGNTAPDTARSTCPEWCVLDHDDYSESDRELGDLIRHLGATSGPVGGFTITIDSDTQPFAIQRAQQTAPDGTVHEDGYLWGGHFFTCQQAVELGEGLLQAIEQRETAGARS